jgi:RNA polymerase sigma-70 factor (ECF subfamily)
MATYGCSTANQALRQAMGTSEVTAAYRQYGPQVLRRCRRILRQQHAAEDAAQEVFLKLWRYGESFREADHKLGWLYRVADRCCFNELRRRRSQPELPVESSDHASAPRCLPEDRDVVLRFLDRFEDRVQRVAVLYYVDEMTHDEIAALTGWSRQTIHKKLLLVRERAQALRHSLLGEAASARRAAR